MRTSLLFILITQVAIVYSQSSNALLDSAQHYRNTSWDQSIMFGHLALRAAQESAKTSTQLEALFAIANTHYIHYYTDSSLYYIEKGQQLAVESGDQNQEGRFELLKADNQIDRNQLQDAIGHYRYALQLFEELGDSTLMCNTGNSLGNALLSSGNLADASDVYFKVLSICQGIENHTRESYTLSSIARINEENRQYEASEMYYQQAIEAADRSQNLLAKASANNNLGILYKNWGKLDLAFETYQKSQEYFEEINHSYGIIASKLNLGILAVKRNEYEIALEFLSEALQGSLDNNRLEAITDANNWLARANLALGNVNDARRFATVALDLCDSLEVLEKEMEAHETWMMIEEQTQNHQQALLHARMFQQLKDSLLNQNSQNRINRLQIQYEAEKQKLQIAELEYSNERKTQRNRSYIFMIIAISIIASMVIWNLITRKRQDRILFERQQLIDQERQRVIELENEKLNQELAFKKQELSAKVLQLCKKNEFLQDLEKQISQLKEVSQSAEVKMTSGKISRRIAQDIDAQEDWEEFLDSFASVHPKFMNSLQEEHGQLSNNDLRLACLLKMNLSSKEIAQMMNISPAGVKKARYRLRKKIELPSDQDMIAYLVGIE